MRLFFNMTESSLKIKIEDIKPDEGLHLSFKDVRALCELESDFPEDVSLKGALLGRADFFRHGGNIHLSGKISGVLLLICHRCLVQCTEAIEQDFFYILEAAEVQDELSDIKEVGLGEDDLNVWAFRDGLISLDEIFREQVLLQVPQKILCSEKCQGLCPHCGTDLNKGKCSCTDFHEDSPFAVLKGLKVKGS